jgi:putative oxidoreductase
MNSSSWLNRNKDVGVLLLRLFIAVWLIYGVQDNILHWDRMLEFSKFLSTFNFPLPLVSAIISVYAQAVAAVMILIGWKIRFAAILMIINFLVALIMVHRTHPFDAMIPALSIIACCALFFFQGAGRFSVDKEKL